MYTWSVPFSSILSVELFDMKVEILVKSIEVHAWCTIEIILFRKLSIFNNVLQDASLWVEFLMSFKFWGCAIIIAIIVNVFFNKLYTVGVNFFDIIIKSLVEVLTSSWFGVIETTTIVIRNKFRINKVMVNHKLCLTFIQLTIFETNYTIAN